MAVSDNTNYELSGSQVKDLAARIKGNTKLAKDLAGGGTRANDTIFMCRIDSDDAAEIAAQMGGGSAGTIEMYMKYGFRLSGTGQWLDNETLGGLLDANTPIVYKKTANAYDMNYEQDLTVIGFDAGYDQSEDNYFPTIRLMSHQWNTSNLGAFNILEVTLKSPEQSGIWYEVNETTMDTIATPYCIIKPSTSAFLQELADEYNETYADPEDPASYINALNVKATVPFMFINQSGVVLKTVRSIGQAIKDTRIVAFNASPSAMSQNSVNVISSHSGGNTYGSFGLLDLAAGDNKQYNVRAGSSTDTYFWAQHMPYVVMRDDANYDTQMPYGYTDDTEAAGAISDAPEAKYQVSKDTNGNLYMAAGTSSASDWKQINNVAPAQMTGATSSTAGTSGVVPAPAAGDDTKFLAGDGTWKTAGGGGGPTVVQTTGQSTTDVMSQKAVTDIIGNVETILHTLNSGGGAQ